MCQDSPVLQDPRVPRDSRELQEPLVDLDSLVLMVNPETLDPQDNLDQTDRQGQLDPRVLRDQLDRTVSLAHRETQGPKVLRAR